MKKKLSRSNVMTLLISVLCLCLCIFMVTGTTFGWFTDVATSKENKILAGTLDVDLVMDKAENGTYVSVASESETATIFGGSNSLYAQNDPTNTLWEPGKTQIVYLGVQNKGNLAIKYNIELTVTDGGLANALEYALIDGATAANMTAKSWTELKTAAGNNVGNVTAGTIKAAENGVLDEIANGTKDETQYFALAVHMKEDADNTYMGKDITIDVTVNASQYGAEADSFGNTYDAQARYADNCLTFSSDSLFRLGTACFDAQAATGLQYSTDAVNWTAFNGDSVTAVQNGDKYYVYLRGDNMTTLSSNPDQCELTTLSVIAGAESSVDCSGNIMTLLDYDDPDHAVMANGAFSYLFDGCKALKSAPSLPATTLSYGCYENMFSSSGLIAPPSLPATTLVEACYRCMFQNCTKLTTAPSLPATQLAVHCYRYMFYGCEALNVAVCDGEETGFVTIPSDADTSQTAGKMFNGTPNADTIGTDGTPIAGKSYKIGTN